MGWEVIILVEVVKKGGTKEQFDSKKIRKSIEKAAIDAGYTSGDIKGIEDEIIKDITEEAQKIGELNTKDIRDSIFNNLNENKPSIVESWKKFDARYKP
jgi:transcriptional regulator NrdR family protein